MQSQAVLSAWAKNENVSRHEYLRQDEIPPSPKDRQIFRNILSAISVIVSTPAALSTGLVPFSILLAIGAWLGLGVCIMYSYPATRYIFRTLN